MVQVSYPGVYIEEIPSGVRTIVGVATSITAFIGRTWKGPDDEPATITSHADYERNFGGLWRDSSISYAVQHSYQNGGRQAIIVRVATRTGANAATAATIDLGGGTILEAASKGTWGRNLVVEVDHSTKDTTYTNLFNIKITDDLTRKEDSEKRGGSGMTETFRNVSVDPNSSRFVKTVLEYESGLVRTTSIGASQPPETTSQADNTSGHDGLELTGTDIEGSEADKKGIYALEKADIF
jgi:hypothetical protein